jgi:hypothetical protein
MQKYRLLGGTAGREGWWMRKEQHKIRTADKKGTAGRKEWWMKKKQQEGKVVYVMRKEEQ